MLHVVSVPDAPELEAPAVGHQLRDRLDHGVQARRDHAHHGHPRALAADHRAVERALVSPVAHDLQLVAGDDEERAGEGLGEAPPPVALDLEPVDAVLEEV